MMNSGDLNRRISRRRFVAIAAAVSGVGLLPRRTFGDEPQSVTWRGVALGAEASLTVQHSDKQEATAAISECLAELARLEAIFSLFRADSALVRLNTNGVLEDAPIDFRVLLGEALLLAERSGGAFDPTIQPLWTVYARHFSALGADPEGPDQREIAAALALVDWRKIDLRSDRIRLLQPGMSVTLNGIAQGYITDKIGELLKSRGFSHVLVNMGEQLALGPKWDGRAWTVGIADPKSPNTAIEKVALSSGAAATSGGYGCRFDAAGRFTHILDPRTGASARRFASVTVLAPRATVADGLSTAFSVCPISPSLLADAIDVYAVSEGTTGRWLSHRT